MIRSFFIAVALMSVGCATQTSDAAQGTDALSTDDFAAVAVTYAEVNLGCDDSGAPTTTPAINLRPGDGHLGEIRIAGDAASQFSTNGTAIVFTPGALTVGTLASAPTCIVLDTGEPATASWNALTPANQVAMTVGHASGHYTLTLLDLTSGHGYALDF